MADGLAAVLLAAAHGQFPPADGAVEVMSGPGSVPGVIVGFTAHLLVAADGVAAGAVFGQLDGRDFSEWMGPRFVSWLAGRVHAEPGSHDAVLCAFGRGGHGGALVPTDRPGHPRVERSARYRRDQRVFALSDDPDAGVVIVGRGVAGRCEIAAEVEVSRRGRGVGRRLILGALAEIDPGVPVFAQVAPANVASLRCFLACGFQPVCSEILLA